MYQSNLLSISKIENQSRIPGKLFQLTRCWTWNQMKGLMFGYWHEALHVSGVQHQDCENIEARGTDLRPSRVHCPIYKNISNIPSLSFPRLLQGQIKAAQLQPDVAFCSSKCERKSRAATDSEGTRHHVFWRAFYYKDACYDATKVVLIKFGFSITYVFNFERRSFQSRR